MNSKFTFYKLKFVPTNINFKFINIKLMLGCMIFDMNEIEFT
jgi:hypothetical protein